MTRSLFLLLAAPGLLSAADPLTVARAEADAAEREVQRLEAAASRASGEAARLKAEQAAAGQAILAAEARLAATEVEQAVTDRALRQRAERLAEGQRPASLLLAGLAQMGRRPPILTLADGGSANEFVMVRALLDSSLPVIRARTASLRAELEQAELLAEAARTSRRRSVENRDALRARQQRFVELERRTHARLAKLGSEALAAGDVALSRAAEAEQLADRSLADRSAARVARELAAFPPAPRRPAPASDLVAPPSPRWALPVTANVGTGFMEVSPAGVRSRGLTFNNRSGAPVFAPANGRVVYAGPFRSRRGVVIVDHGQGWMTLLTEIRTNLPTGARVRGGDPLGSALGPLTVELTRHGRPQPAALIAGSSALLSNDGKSG